jgi:hypothetical protein
MSNTLMTAVSTPISATRPRLRVLRMNDAMSSDAIDEQEDPGDDGQRLEVLPA